MILDLDCEPHVVRSLHFPGIGSERVTMDFHDILSENTLLAGFIYFVDSDLVD